MRRLLDLDEQYKYEKIGASIIGKDAGNFAGMRRRAFLLLLMQTSPIYIYWI